MNKVIVGSTDKYHFKKWKWKKNLPSKAKSAIATQLQTRAAAGKSSTAITFQGRPVDSKKIRRHLKEAARKDIVLRCDLGNSETSQQILSGPTLPFGNRMYDLAGSKYRLFPWHFDKS